MSENRRIDRIEKRPRTRKVDIYADGAIVITIALTTAQEEALKVGDPLSDGDIQHLRYEDDRRRSLQTGLRLITLRPHSESEIRDRLRRKGFGQLLIDRVVERLRELGYLDDLAFARYWAETRQAARPRSRRMLQWELETKGIDTTIAGAVTAPLDDDDAAYAAAARRARSLTANTEAEFRQKLASVLQRRGFGWNSVRRAVDRCWTETGAANSD